MTANQQKRRRCLLFLKPSPSSAKQPASAPRAIGTFFPGHPWFGIDKGTGIVLIRHRRSRHTWITFFFPWGARTGAHHRRLRTRNGSFFPWRAGERRYGLNYRFFNRRPYGTGDRYTEELARLDQVGIGNLRIKPEQSFNRNTKTLGNAEKRIPRGYHIGQTGQTKDLARHRQADDLPRKD